MKHIKEELKLLEELLRKASKYLEPSQHHDMMKSIMDRDARGKLQEKYPKCWVPINIGRPAPLMVPICNRMGFEDPEIIQFSMNMVDKLSKRGLCAPDDLEEIRGRLKRLLSRFSGDIPKPAGMAAKKGKVTRMFNNIKKYLDAEIRT